MFFSRLVFFVLLTVATLDAQTLGRLRLVDFSPRTAATVSAVTLGTNPVITTSAPHGRSTGDAVWIYEPWDVDRRETDAVGNAPSGNRGRGYFVITVTDSTHFTLASEMYTNTTNLSTYIVAIGDKIVPLTTYTLRDGPKVWLDGVISKGAWASGTTYRAYESVTDGGNTYMSIADSNLNHLTSDTSWWKQVDPTKLGPGTFTASLRNTSGKASVAGTYTPLKSLQTNINTIFPSGASTYFDFTVQNYGFTGVTGQFTALNWMMTGDTTSYTRALQMATRAEDLAEGTPACDGTAYCGFRQGSSDSAGLDYARLFAARWAPGLALIYETLSPSQKQAVRDRLLNDNDILHNGIEDVGQGCTPFNYISGPGTVAVRGTGDTNGIEQIIGTGVDFTSIADLQPGAVIMEQSPLRVIGRVKSIDSATQLTLEPIIPTQVLGWNFSTHTANPYDMGAWYYTRPWAYGGAKTCGWTHFIKHVTNTAHAIPGYESQWSSDYGTSGPVAEDDWGENNRTISSLTPFIAFALTFGQDDIRAVRMGEQAINYFMTQTLAQGYKSRMTGKDGHGTEYGLGRTENMVAEIAIMIKNSLTTTPPGPTTGSYLRNALASFQYIPWLARPGWVMPWSVGYQAAYSDLQSLGSRLKDLGATLLYFAYLNPGDDWAGAAYHYLRTRRTVSYPYWTQSYGDSRDGWDTAYFLAIAAPFYDPDVASVNPTTTQPSYLVQSTSDIDECISSGLYCVPDMNQTNIWSMSGWTDTSTQVHIAGGASAPIMNEDAYGVVGNVSILQNNGATNAAYLLGGNGLGISGGFGSGFTPFSGIENGNTLSVFDGSTDLYPTTSNYQYGAADRVTANNNYVYARVNLTPSIRGASTSYDPAQAVPKSAFHDSAGVTRAHRHVIHFPGSASHVVVYDDMATSVPNQLRAYWHYQVTDLATPAVRHPDWMTTFDSSAKQAVLTVPSVGRLSTQILPVSGQVALVAANDTTNACNGTWPAWNPSNSCAGVYTPRSRDTGGVTAAVLPGTYRAHACASTNGTTCANVTSGEWITVHRSSPSGSDTLPTITQPLCSGTGGNCAAVEIQDASSPKVALFARAGANVTGMTVTTTHSGTARYVVAGVTGHWTAYRNGVEILTTDVSNTEGSFTFTTTAGNIALSGTPLIIASPTPLTFRYTLTGTLPASQSVTINAVGTTLDNWSLTDDSAWLSATPTSGNATGTTSISIDTTGLSAATYNGTISIATTTTGVTNSPLSLPVSLIVYTAPSITTSSLAGGSVNISYSQTLTGTDGQTAYSWDIASGALPGGLSLDASTGVISGTPTTPGTFNFVARLTDAGGAVTTRSLSIIILALPVGSQSGVAAFSGVTRK